MHCLICQGWTNFRPVWVAKSIGYACQTYCTSSSQAKLVWILRFSKRSTVCMPFGERLRTGQIDWFVLKLPLTSTCPPSPTRTPAWQLAAYYVRHKTTWLPLLHHSYLSYSFSPTVYHEYVAKKVSPSGEAFQKYMKFAQLSDTVFNHKKPYLSHARPALFHCTGSHLVLDRNFNFGSRSQGSHQSYYCPVRQS